MKLQDFRLSTRITVITLLIVAVGAVALFFLERAHNREDYISEQSINLEKNLQAERIRLSQTIDTLRQDVLFLSNIPAVSGIMRAASNGYDARDGNTRAQWEDRLNKVFFAFSASHPDCYLVRYIAVADGGKELVRVDNRDGHIDVTPPRKLVAKDNQDFFKEYLELQEGQIGLSEFDLSPDIADSPKRTLRAAAPVFTPAGKLFGIVIVNFDISRLLESAALGLPSGIQTYMANRDGQYLLHPDSQRAFRLEPGKKGEITADFPFLKTMFDPQAADYRSLRDFATKASNYAAASRIHFDTGHPERFLLLMYYIPDAVAASHIAPIPVADIVAGLAAMLLISWIALLALRRTFSPLEQVAAAADKIAAGDQNIMLPKIGGGEIGSLTDALDAMMGKLRQREKLLRESETRYRRLHESMMDAFSMVDMSGRLLEFNHAYREMLGYSVEELQHLNYADLTPEKWREFEARIIEEQVIPNGYSQVYEKEYIRKDGTAFPVELKTFLLRDANNQPEAMWAIVRDITERKQLEMVLRRSEESLNRAQAVGQIGSWLLDIPTNRLEWSAETYRMFDIPQQQAINLEIFVAAIHPDDRNFVLNAWGESMAGAPYDIEHRIVVGGQTRWVRERAQIERGSEGRPLTGIGTVQDITDRKHAEDALRASENRYRLLVESSPFCIHEIDLEGRLQSMNRAGLNMLGLDDVTKICGAPYLGAVSRQDAGRVGALLQDAINNGTSSHFEFAATGDMPRYFKSCFIPIKDTNGKVLKLMGITEDITELKQLEEMRAKMASVGRFNIAGETTNTLTHELSQPLTACNNYLDVCLRRIDDKDWGREKLKETLQLAHKQVERAGIIINHFKKQVRRQEFEHTLFDVNLLVRDVMAFLAGEIKRQGISVHMGLFPLPQVMACREEIRQVLLGLCQNAIEAMHSSPQRELYVTTRIESGHVLVAVRDSGEGILSARMKTLFEPFLTSKEDRLGLSLSICRSIIEKHGGRIWADPQRESGAEFYFTLPIKVHHE